MATCMGTPEQNDKTDTCEIITVPQIRLLAVIISLSHCSANVGINLMSHRDCNIFTKDKLLHKKSLTKSPHQSQLPKVHSRFKKD